MSIEVESKTNNKGLETTIKIVESLKKILAEDRQQKQPLFLKIKDDFIFKISRNRLKKMLDLLLDNLNIQERTLYETRHTFASVMLSKGEEPLWVGCKMLGHKDLNETYKSYAKYLPKSVTNRAVFLKDYFQ